MGHRDSCSNLNTYLGTLIFYAPILLLLHPLTEIRPNRVYARFRTSFLDGPGQPHTAIPTYYLVLLFCLLGFSRFSTIAILLECISIRFPDSPIQAFSSSNSSSNNNSSSSNNGSDNSFASFLIYNLSWRRIYQPPTQLIC